MNHGYDYISIQAFMSYMPVDYAIKLKPHFFTYMPKVLTVLSTGKKNQMRSVWNFFYRNCMMCSPASITN